MPTKALGTPVDELRMKISRLLTEQTQGGEMAGGYEVLLSNTIHPSTQSNPTTISCKSDVLRSPYPASVLPRHEAEKSATGAKSTMSPDVTY
jgi:hypothetical protein